jgi:hypothetical protein
LIYITKKIILYKMDTPENNVVPQNNKTLIYTLFGITLFLIIIAIIIAVIALLKKPTNGTNGTSGITGTMGDTGTTGATGTTGVIVTNSNYLFGYLTQGTGGSSAPLPIFFDQFPVFNGWSGSTGVTGTTGSIGATGPAYNGFLPTVSGIYSISYSIQFNTVDTGQQDANTFISVNETQYANTQGVQKPPTSAGSTGTLSCSDVLVSLNAGDVVSIRFFVNDGGVFIVNNGSFSIVRIA